MIPDNNCKLESHLLVAANNLNITTKNVRFVENHLQVALNNLHIAVKNVCFVASHLYVALNNLNVVEKNVCFVENNLYIVAKNSLSVNKFAGKLIVFTLKKINIYTWVAVYVLLLFVFWC